MNRWPYQAQGYPTGPKSSRWQTLDPQAGCLPVASDTESDADKLAALRTLRNMKLEETDYLGLSDNTLSNDMNTYRQSLRDITKTYSSLDAEGFAWPTEPS